MASHDPYRYRENLVLDRIPPLFFGAFSLLRLVAHRIFFFFLSVWEYIPSAPRVDSLEASYILEELPLDLERLPLELLPYSPLSGKLAQQQHSVADREILFHLKERHFYFAN